MHDIDAITAQLRASARWRDSEFTLTPLDGGMSNETYLISRSNSRFVLRCAGQKTYFTNLKYEIEFIHHFKDLGLAPALVEKNKAYVIYEFISGTPLIAENFAQPEVITAIVSAIQCLHSHPFRFTRRFHPWKKLQSLYQMVRKNFALTIPVHEAEAMMKRLATVAELLDMNPQDFVPCHLDLIPGNIVRVDHGGSPDAPTALGMTRERTEVRFIDWEYAAMAPRLLEFANIFTELNTDPSTERSILAPYCAYNNLCIDSAQYTARLFRCLSLFYWYLWAIVNAPRNPQAYAAYQTRSLAQLHRVLGRLDSATGRH